MVYGAMDAPQLNFRWFETVFLIGTASGISLGLAVCFFKEEDMKDMMLGAAIGFTAALLLLLFGVSMTFE